MTTLLLAIRHDDVRVVRELLDDRALNVNEESVMEGSTSVPQELPSYPTIPLIEACRCGDEKVLRLLLARKDLDVNKRATKLRYTALADACARGDAASARVLLEDPRVDPNLADDYVAHPALYACMNGSVEILEVLAAHGLLTDALEESLLATAAANQQARVQEFVEDHYVKVRPLSALKRPQQEKKVRFVCEKHDPSHTGYVPSNALASICEALGVTLSPEELREAYTVLRVGGKVADDGQMLLRVDDIVAVWLLD